MAKTIVLQVRVTEDERAALQQEAGSLSLSELVREKLFRPFSGSVSVDQKALAEIEALQAEVAMLKRQLAERPKPTIQSAIIPEPKSPPVAGALSKSTVELVSFKDRHRR